MALFQMSFILSLLFILTGCASLSEAVLTYQDFGISVVISGVDGDGLGGAPGAIWINDEKEFLSFTGRLNRLRLGAESTPIPAIDFKHEGVLAIWMGRKPTGGYKIESAMDKISIRDRTAIVSVRWIRPDKDDVQALRISSPYLALRMKRGDYNRIKVRDEDGVIWAETELQE